MSIWSQKPTNIYHLNISFSDFTPDFFSSNLLHQSEAEMHSNRFQEYWRCIADANYVQIIPSYENTVWEL